MNNGILGETLSHFCRYLIVVVASAFCIMHVDLSNEILAKISGLASWTCGGVFIIMTIAYTEIGRYLSILLSMMYAICFGIDVGVFIKFIMMASVPVWKLWLVLILSVACMIGGIYSGLQSFPDPKLASTTVRIIVLFFVLWAVYGKLAVLYQVIPMLGWSVVGLGYAAVFLANMIAVHNMRHIGMMGFDGVDKHAFAFLLKTNLVWVVGREVIFLI